MAHEIEIAGEKVELSWTKASSRLMRLRLCEIDFDWSKDLQNKRMPVTMVKLCWALLPSEVFKKYIDHEDMYSAMNEEEDVKMYQGVGKIIDDMIVGEEKKSTLPKSPSPKSNSD